MAQPASAASSPSPRDRDLRLLLRRAAAAEDGADAEAVGQAALARVEQLRGRTDAAPERLDEIARLAQLVTDKAWTPPPTVPRRVAAALQYFLQHSEGAAAAEAFAVSELLMQDLRRELEGFEEFRSERERLARRRFAEAGQREQALARRRRRIRARIQSRRFRDEHGWLGRFGGVISR
jgi:hypothetical protein